MGLISAITQAAQSALADSWREYFYCDSIPVDVLITKANKRQNRNSSNTKGSDNVISNGSIIAVADGQCMLIVEQGKVVEVCAEPGEFVWDSSTEPSIFYGSLGENIKKSFAQIGKRFTFGGDTAKDQRVYYVNTKEILGNKYGTPNPVPFRVVDKNIGLDVDIAIRCHGEYSYRVTDPVLFYTNVASNVTSVPEVCKNSAILVNPNDVNELSYSMERVLTDSFLKLTMIERGLLTSNKYSWKNTALNTIEAYRNIIEF